jgi:hypothetical protein
MGMGVGGKQEFGLRPVLQYLCISDMEAQRLGNKRLILHLNLCLHR